MMASEEIAESAGLDFSILQPLIEETIEKIHQSPPSKNQTGPAARHNNLIISNHLSMLDDKTQLQDFYKSATDYIINRLKK